MCVEAPPCAQVASAAARGERAASVFDGVDILGGTARALDLEERRARAEGVIEGMRHLNATEALDAIKSRSTAGGAGASGDETAASVSSSEAGVDVDWYDDTLPESVTDPNKCVAGCVNGVCRKGRCRRGSSPRPFVHPLHTSLRIFCTPSSCVAF